jgi:hypothetical protein
VTATGLFRSGWWVLVAAAAVSVLVAYSVLRASFGPEVSNGVDPISLDPCLVDRDDLVQAMARDGLKALSMPSAMTPDQVSARNENERGKLLVSTDRVIGVVVDGEARAYPLRLLRWHESVNDVVGGRAIAVTYSPLSGGMAVWDRTVEGDRLELAVSGRIYNSNTLLYDRRADGSPSSLWHQLTGEAIAGPAVGHRLQPLPSVLQTWASWTEAHPETTVMAPDPSSKSLYKRDPYHSYRGSDVLRFPVDPLPPEGTLAYKDLVAIVTTGDHDHVFALDDLAEAVGSPRGQWAAMLDEDVYMTSFDAEAGTFAVEPRDEAISPPAVRFAYWFEWWSLHPGTVPLP